jgi:hypothetical protein
MGLLDLASSQPSGGGLLDFAISDPGARLGISLLAASSPKLRGLGQAMAQQDAWQQNQNDAAWQKTQRDRQTREWGLQDQENALAGQFFRPATQALSPLAGDSAAGILPSAGRPGTPASFDMPGYAQALMPLNPKRGMELMQSMQKDSQINKLDAKDFTPASLAKFAQSRNYGDLVRLDKAHFADTGGSITAMDAFTGRPINEVQKSGNPFTDLLARNESGDFVMNRPLIGAKSMIARAGAQRSVNNIINTQETEQSKAYGKGVGDMRLEITKAGFNAPSSIAKLNRMEQLLSGVEGGKLAPMGMEVASAAKSLGLSLDPKLGNKEAAQALAVEMALSMKQPGSGATSDKDFDNFIATVPDLSKTAEGRGQIITTLRAKAQRDIRIAQMARDYAKQRGGVVDDQFFDGVSQFMAENPIFSAPAGPGVSPTMSQADAILNRGRK